MKFGASMFFTDYSMTAPELAVALEERFQGGYDSHLDALERLSDALGVPARNGNVPVLPHLSFEDCLWSMLAASTIATVAGVGLVFLTPFLGVVACLPVWFVSYFHVQGLLLAAGPEAR